LAGNSNRMLSVASDTSIGAASRFRQEAAPIEQMTSSVPFQWKGLSTQTGCPSREYTEASACNPTKDAMVAAPTSARSSILVCMPTVDHAAVSGALAAR